MPSMTKVLIWFLLFISIPFYLVYIVKEGIEFQIAGGILILSLTSLLMFGGGNSIVKITEQKINYSAQIEKKIEPLELPAPVLELEGPSYRREEKLRRTRKITNSEENIPKIQQKLIDTPSPEILSENDLENRDGKNIAMKYVASSDPQSQMESEIDNFIREKRIIRDELKKKITIERRIELAKRKISKVDKWAGIEDGEDISKQLRGINHGLTVISESKVTDSSIPYGISYVRIDHQRILKVRMPLKIDTPSNDAKLSNNNLDPTPNLILPNPPGLPPLPNPPGLPPLPNPPGLPPLPNPPGLPPFQNNEFNNQKD